MLDKKIVDALNKQIGMEYHSAYVYLNISLYYEDLGLSGFENWFKVQAREECEHAERIIAYLQDNDAEVVLPAIPAPAQKFKNALEPAEISYKNECDVSKAFLDIAKIAKDVDDFRTIDFLNWFHKEQVEEERTASDLVKRMTLFGTEAKGLIYMDKEMGERIK